MVFLVVSILAGLILMWFTCRAQSKRMRFNPPLPVPNPDALRRYLKRPDRAYPQDGGPGPK